MPGGFSEGFDLGFGPLVASGTALPIALFKYLGFLGIKENKSMETLRINGIGASGQLNGTPTMAYVIDSIELDVPLDEVGATDPYVTVSGSSTGATTYHSSVKPNIRFQPNETIYVTTSNFSGEYSAIIGYTKVGDMNCYMQTDKSRNARGEVVYYPNFWRYR